MKQDKTEVWATIIFLLVVFVIVSAFLFGDGSVGIPGLLLIITMRQAMEQDWPKEFDAIIILLMVFVIVPAFMPGRGVWVAMMMMETIDLITITGICFILGVCVCVILDMLRSYLEDQVRASSRKNGRQKGVCRLWNRTSPRCWRR